jgi:C1A family cysteine protease
MIFKSPAIILSLALGAMSFSPCKNVGSNSAKMIAIHRLFNSPVDTGYSDNTGHMAPVSDTGTYYSSNVETLPPAVRLDMPVPGNQGKQASCSAWAIVYGAGSYYMHVTTGKPYSDSENLSPAFIYNQLPKGSGGSVAFMDNLELFRAEGACSLKSMPYKPNDYSTQPDSAQQLDAAKCKIEGWEKIDMHDLILLKKALFQKRPVIFFITTDEGFNKITLPFTWKERCGRLGTVHSMVIAGYDDKRNAFLVMNSWGTFWGDKGFAWIDYQFFLENASPKGFILI